MYPSPDPDLMRSDSSIQLFFLNSFLPILPRSTEVGRKLLYTIKTNSPNILLIFTRLLKYLRSKNYRIKKFSTFLPLFSKTSVKCRHPDIIELFSISTVEK